MPVGYVLLAAGIALVVAVGAFIMGHSKGQQQEQQRLETLLQPANTEVSDPLVQSERMVDLGARKPNSPLPPRGAHASQSKVVGSGAGVQQVGAGGSPGGSWGPVVVQPGAKDPRVKGFHYYVLAETNESGAKRLAEFCRESGLETYVVFVNNQLRRVIAFPGFDLSVNGRSSPPVAGLRDKIYEVGEKWKRQGGNTNFRDAYLRPYNG